MIGDNDKSEYCKNCCLSCNQKNHLKSYMIAVIDGEDVRFNFQSDKDNFNEENSQLKLKYLGFGFPSYYVSYSHGKVFQGECKHIWGSLDALDKENEK